MANNFKNYFLKDSGTTANTVYTVGAGVSATAIGMTISNTTSSPITANVIVTSSSVDYYLVKGATIPVGGTLVPIGGDQKVVLEAADIIKIETSASASADVILSVLEIS